MNIEEFNKTKWKSNMKCHYNQIEGVVDIVSVDFVEKLIGLEMGSIYDEPTWVRCENVDIIKD